MTGRITPLLALLVIVMGFTALPSTVYAAGSVTVNAWSCPDEIDPASTDPELFSAACTAEAVDFTFALTSGEITRRRITAPGKPAAWPSVSGKLILALEKPENENAVLFCSLDDGEPGQIKIEKSSAELDLTTGTALECLWYRMPLNTSASPVASPAILIVEPTATSTASSTPTQIPSPMPSQTPTNTPTMTATPTATETSTSTPTRTSTPPATASPTLTATAVPTETSIPSATPTHPPSATPQPTRTAPPTATPNPTATEEVATSVPTETATKEPGPRALSTQVALAIDGRDPDYHLDLHQMTYELGDELLVYPDPDGPADGQFALIDFVVNVTFINPPRDDDGTWDYGILFGPTVDDEYYQIAISSTGDWYLILDGEIIRQGEIEGMLVDYRERNDLTFIVTGDRALIFLNGELVTSLRLDPRETGGQLWLATGNQDSSDIAFLNLDVWSLP